MSATWFTPSSCTGSCNQGRACDCLPDVPQQPIKPIKTVEQDHPWLWLLFAATVVLTIAISAAVAG